MLAAFMQRHPRTAFHTGLSVSLALILATDLWAGQEKGGGGSGVTLPTTEQDFFQPGTQILGAGVPGTLTPMVGTDQCVACHSNFGPTDPFLMGDEFNTWTVSMMGQSARDPLFHAGLAIANQDATGAGEFCIRCHAPNAWLGGHATPPDASAFDALDYQGVACNFCHRAVNPVYVSGTSPPEDEQIINDLVTAGLHPPQISNARYVVDPIDARRGPFNDVPANLHPGTPQPQIIYSTFHRDAELCWTCHDVSNPLMTRQIDGTYAINPHGAPHPSHQQTDMLPLHRTYSEWKNSYYSSIGVQHNGRFGGNHINNPVLIANGTAGVMKDCQDCHMPDADTFGCNIEFPPFFQRPDTPQHSFMGSNTWVLNAVRTVDADINGQADFPDSETGFTDELIAGAIARNTQLLERASDVELAKVGQNLRVRILNRGGHKLPTGFPDGRRMWINVKFYDCGENLVDERGEYDFGTAVLNTADTEVYEIVLGINGADYAKSLNRPEGPTFHFMLANAILKDNRIPPAGFSNVVAIQNQSAPVGAAYSNGQHWDDTLFPIPADVKTAVVTVYYQLNSKEFMEHLRDDNTTNNRGQVAYDLWVQHGMSAPVAMDTVELEFFHPADINHDGAVEVNDLLAVVGAWGACPALPAPCPADITGDGMVDVNDLLAVVGAWGPC